MYNSGLKPVSHLSSALEPLRFPLVYPYGTSGYTPLLCKKDKKGKSAKVSIQLTDFQLSISAK